MMVRAVFSVLVTFGLLAGAVAWHGPPPEGDAPAVAELEPAVERVREVAAAAGATLAEVKREVAPVVKQASALAAALVEASAAAPEPAPEPEPETVIAAEVVIEEARLEPVAELPFLEGPADGDAVYDAAPGAAEAVAVAGGMVDQEAWAGLIRRMLAIYERVEPER
ncbi:MAG: hypothetical protein JRG84_17055 [Deltaproteobacteria bacterium]|nr:hypothetical protein [Deltaproteobacteria bacterium]